MTKSVVPSDKEIVKLMKDAIKEESYIQASQKMGFGTTGYWKQKKGKSTKPQEIY